ncbi:hypothetical protein LMG33818_000920 [Halomonadaceae bacterium LMG 33818]|uniref:hypothetical protein n=1 Tax=Cernens ardua TaxID=3402176 RepID=UPI003EDBC230
MSVESDIADYSARQGRLESKDDYIYRIEEDAHEKLTKGEDYNDYISVDLLVDWMCDAPDFNKALVKAASGDSADLWKIMDETLNGEKDENGRIVKAGILERFRDELLGNSTGIIHIKDMGFAQRVPKHAHLNNPVLMLTGTSR